MSEFMQRPTRPAQPAQTNTAQAAAPAKAAAKGVKAQMDKSGLVGIILAAALAILMFAVVALLITNDRQSATTFDNDRINTDRYQSVFLNDTNGQVYFGKLVAINNSTYQLTDVYYPQVNSAVDPATGQQQTTGISLAKRGLNELQKPEDVMYIQRAQVLYWENLNDDGQVACAIADYKESIGEESNKSENCETPNASSVDPTQGSTIDPAGTQPAGTPQVNDTPGTPAVTPQQ